MSGQSDLETPHPASAISSAAQHYEEGLDSVQDQAKALELYRLAAEQGCVMAQTILGGSIRLGTLWTGMTARRFAGSGERPTEAIPRHNMRWRSCIVSAAGWPRTMPKR